MSWFPYKEPNHLSSVCQVVVSWFHTGTELQGGLGGLWPTLRFGKKI
jgi:hypothetical protein